MILVLLPLSHFVFSSLCLAWHRGARALTQVSWGVDAALIGALWWGVRHGKTISVGLGGWGRSLGIELSADWVGLVFALLALLVGGAVSVYLSRVTLRSYFYVLLHLLLGCVFSILFAQDLFNIYVTLELLTLVSFLLVGYERTSIQIWVSLKYLMLTALGMGIYLLGLAVLYYHAGTVNLSELGVRLGTGAQQPWVIVSSSLLVTGVAVKAGIFVFSLWLPAAHAVAMPAVGALLSGLVIKMGVVVLMRLAAVFPVSVPLLVLGTMTGLLGIAYAVSTYDLRKLLAFHTLSQIGYLAVGLGIGTRVELTGAVEYAVGHGLFKALLFLAAGTVIASTGQNDIRSILLWRSRIPVNARLALLVAVLANLGLPPFAGFFGKAVLLSGAESVLIETILIAISIGTVVSFLKLLPLFWWGRGPSASRSQSVSFLLLSVPIVLFSPLMQWLLPEWCWSLSFRTFPAVESVLIVVFGCLVYRFLPWRRIRMPDWVFHLEEATVIIISGFLLVCGLSLLP